MEIIFFDNEGNELLEKEQNMYCLTHNGKVASWDESEGWNTNYCEGMTFIISAPEENDD